MSRTMCVKLRNRIIRGWNSKLTMSRTECSTFRCTDCSKALPESWRMEAHTFQDRSKLHVPTMPRMAAQHRQELIDHVPTKPRTSAQHRQEAILAVLGIGKRKENEELEVEVAQQRRRDQHQEQRRTASSRQHDKNSKAQPSETPPQPRRRPVTPSERPMHATTEVHSPRQNLS